MGAAGHLPETNRRQTRLAAPVDSQILQGLDRKPRSQVLRAPAFLERPCLQKHFRTSTTKICYGIILLVRALRAMGGSERGARIHLPRGEQDGKFF